MGAGEQDPSADRELLLEGTAQHWHVTQRGHCTWPILMTREIARAMVSAA